MSLTARARATLIALGTLALLSLALLLAPGAAAVDGQLAVTGVDIMWVVLGAVAVVVIGVAAVVLSRRSRK